jgi:hypothetical protein
VSYRSSRAGGGSGGAAAGLAVQRRRSRNLARSGLALARSGTALERYGRCMIVIFFFFSFISKQYPSRMAL